MIAMRSQSKCLKESRNKHVDGEEADVISVAKPCYFKWAEQKKNSPQKFLDVRELIYDCSKNIKTTPSKLQYIKLPNLKKIVEHFISNMEATL